MSDRRAIPGLGVRTRLGATLPAMFHDDDLAQRWCDGLDEVLAPVPATLDSFWSYLDPMLAPDDFVEWLAGWVGLEVDQTWDDRRRRELVASAHSLFDARGTVEGLADVVELYVGARPEIEEGGGATWSPVPDSALPGDGAAPVVVRVAVEDPEQVDAARLERLVAANRPAHILYRVEITTAAGPEAAASPSGLAPPPVPTDGEATTPDAEAGPGAEEDTE